MGQLKDKAIRNVEAAARQPVKFGYALKAYTAEIRPDGWWITKTPLSIANEKPSWSGPYPTVEDACIAIARCLAVELANRHAAIVGTHGIKPGAPLYGLQVTKLRVSRRKSPS